MFIDENGLSYYSQKEMSEFEKASDKINSYFKFKDKVNS